MEINSNVLMFTLLTTFQPIKQNLQIIVCFGPHFQLPNVFSTALFFHFRLFPRRNFFLWKQKKTKVLLLVIILTSYFKKTTTNFCCTENTVAVGHQNLTKTTDLFSEKGFNLFQRLCEARNGLP